MRHTQRGGTFLGLVIGVVIGLALALAVAVYVMRVPVPFMDRGAVQKNGGAADAQKAKDWDPNAPLAGRNPARPATATSGASSASAAAPEVKSSAPVAVAAPGRAASATRAEATRAARSEAARPAPTPSADPLGDLAKAKAGTAAGPAAPTPTADPFAYFVQAGAFRTPEDAEAQRAKLSLQGVEARVSEREQAGRVVYRVRVGPFDSLDAAERVKERLAGAGFDAALVRVQR